MRRLQSPFCDTTAVRKQVKKLSDFRSNNWRGFDGNCHTFYNLEQKVAQERDYLRQMWDDQIVNDKRLSRWTALPAFYDTPIQERNYTKPSYRDRYNRQKTIWRVCKYDILHDREAYLERLYDAIFKLFSDWHFVTKGWMAY